MAAMSDAKKRANKKWNDKNLNVKYGHIHLVVPKGELDIMKERAAQEGKSLNGFICGLIRSRIGKDDSHTDLETVERMKMK